MHVNAFLDEIGRKIILNPSASSAAVVSRPVRELTGTLKESWADAGVFFMCGEMQDGTFV